MTVTDSFPWTYKAKIFVGRSLHHVTHVQIIMLIKHPKPNYRKWLKRGAIALFAVEAVCFIASYGIWHKVNTDRGLTDKTIIIENLATISIFRFSILFKKQLPELFGILLQGW